jgi:superfamily II DNA helicase RecQ
VKQSGSIKILYLTPEYLANDFDILIEFNNKIGIDLVAVDEAHCVSQVIIFFYLI